MSFIDKTNPKPGTFLYLYKKYKKSKYLSALTFQVIAFIYAGCWIYIYFSENQQINLPLHLTISSIIMSFAYFTGGKLVASLKYFLGGLCLFFLAWLQF